VKAGGGHVALQDPHLSAAVTTWRSRFVANGVDVADVDAILARVRVWEDWCETWHRMGVRYAEMAQEADAQGHLRTGRDLWRRASLMAHFGKYLFVHDRDAYRRAHRDTVAWYAKSAPREEPPAMAVTIPYQGVGLHGYLRVPHRGAPLAVCIAGLDSVKEELHRYTDDLTARGVATLTLDGPGQGEAEEALPFEPAWERVAQAVLETARGWADVDADRVALVGVSMGGYFALRGALLGEPVRAACALGGFVQYADEWPVQPELTKRAFQYRTHSANREEATEKTRAFSLLGRMEEIRCPVLVLEGGKDRHRNNPNSLSTIARGRFERLFYPEGGHVCNNVSARYRPRVADWVADHLVSPTG